MYSQMTRFCDITGRCGARQPGASRDPLSDHRLWLVPLRVKITTFIISGLPCDESFRGAFSASGCCRVWDAPCYFVKQRWKDWLWFYLLHSHFSHTHKHTCTPAHIHTLDFQWTLPISWLTVQPWFKWKDSGTQVFAWSSRDFME